MYTLILKYIVGQKQRALTSSLLVYNGLIRNLTLTVSNFLYTGGLQIHGNSAEGRILHGNSPCELIECFTESVGRPPQLPEWIISGAVVGMQGGTEIVRHIWNELKAYNVPISAFWLQVIHIPA